MSAAPRNFAEGEFGLDRPRPLGQPDFLLATAAATAAGVFLASLVTQWVAARLQYQPELGPSLWDFEGWSLYSPWAAWQWAERLPAHGAGAALSAKIAVLTRAPLLGGMLAGVLTLTVRHRHARNRVQSLQGSARWATLDEIKKAKLLGGSGVVLGQIPDRRGVYRYLRHDGPEHVISFAPTRSGKGVGQVLPTLLSWPHAVVVSDIKGENFELTSGYRSAIGQTICRLDYAAPPERSSGYNPLAEIRVGSSREVADLQLAAMTLANDSGKEPTGGEKHWLFTSAGLLGGAMLHVLYREKAAGRTASLRQVRRELSTAVLPHDIPRTWLDFPHDSADGWVSEEALGLLCDCAQQLLQARREEVRRAFAQAKLAFRAWLWTQDEDDGDPVTALATASLHQPLSAQAVGDLVASVGLSDPSQVAALAGAIVHNIFVELADGERASSQHVTDCLDGKRSRRAMLCSWTKYPHDTRKPWTSEAGHDLLVTVANIQLGRDEREAASVMSTALRALDIFDDPNVAANTARHDFAIEDLVRPGAPMTLYLVLRSGDFARLRPLVRLVYEQIMTRLTEELPKAVRPGRAATRFRPWAALRCRLFGASPPPASPTSRDSRERLLLLLDEFTAVGALPAIERALPFCAGYGIKVMIIVQDNEQLKACYGTHETIFSNCHIRTAYAPNESKPADMISKMLGKTTVIKRTRSRNLKMGTFAGGGLTEAEQEHGVPLLTADEVMALPATEIRSDTRGPSRVVEPGDMILFAAGIRPVRAKKAQHFDDPVLRHRASFAPAEVPAPAPESASPCAAAVEPLPVLARLLTAPPREDRSAAPGVTRQAHGDDEAALREAFLLPDLPDDEFDDFNEI